MLKSMQYRLNPTKTQAQQLDGQLEECRWLYNHLLAARRDAWEERQESLTYHTQATTLPALKQERPALHTVHSQVLQNVAVRIDLGFKAFFRRVKAGEKPGYPRFRGKGRYDSMTFPQYGNGCQMAERVLKLSKVGAVRVIAHRPLEGTPKTCTIRRTSTGKWYVTMPCEVAPAPLESTGEVVARIHERIRHRRGDFCHQLSGRVVHRFDTIVVEDLSVNQLVHNHCLAKSIQDAAWSQFTAHLAYKAAYAGRAYVAVNPAYTSQDCSQCGHRQRKTLADRLHCCPCCGLTLDRDHNAALNILRLGQQSLGFIPRSPGL